MYIVWGNPPGVFEYVMNVSSRLTCEVKQNYEYLHNVSLSKTSSGGHSHLVPIQLLHGWKGSKATERAWLNARSTRESVKKVQDVPLYFHTVAWVLSWSTAWRERTGIQHRVVRTLYFSLRKKDAQLHCRSENQSNSGHSWWTLNSLNVWLREHFQSFHLRRSEGDSESSWAVFKSRTWVSCNWSRSDKDRKEPGCMAPPRKGGWAQRGVKSGKH